LAPGAIEPQDDPLAVRAAKSVLLELLTMLGEVSEAITVIGGSVPPLLLQEPRDDLYAGTLDVDLALDTEWLNEAGDELYATVAEHLTGRGYVQVDPPFRWLRTVTIGDRSIDVYLDLLAPPPEELGRNRRHVRFQEEGMARRLDGGTILSDLRVQAEIEGTLPDGRQNRERAYVAAPGALIVLKALALNSRDKPKDAYDIDYVLQHLSPEGVGPRIVADELRPLRETAVVQQAIAILAEKFESADSYGPQGVALYRRLTLGSDEADAVQGRSFALVQDLLERLVADRH
jgi:hypothetical protein